MKSLLVLRNIAVENANAITGITYGFPAISNFLGFTHALSRSLRKDHGLALGGCAVICHDYAVQAYRPAGWGDYVFGLTRNPLTKEAKSAPFVEEGRMHMNVSLAIECDFTGDSFALDVNSSDQNIKSFESYILNKISVQRLAGGAIQSVRQVQFLEIPEELDARHKFNRQQLFKLLPGFVLVDRSDLLREHYQSCLVGDPDTELMDAWLDFVAVKYRAEAAVEDKISIGEQGKASWYQVEKPAEGWLVPIAAGFKAISPLFENGEVANTRDSNSPFRFVESAYTIGQWISPHRVQDIDHLFWRYYIEEDWYLCQNHYRPVNELKVESSL